ncbi:MAG TPA: TolC family protein, partial [Cyclobacteriaceae bacterium]|nr:TolC family protein [Cyclobacteriaceae bacterium]
MRRVVLILIVLISVPALAQEAKKWTLKECVDIALENNLRIKRSFYNVESFRANLLQSKGSFLPTLNAGGGFTKNYGRALNPVTNQFVNRNSDAINPSLNASLTLFNGLRLQNTFRQSQRDVLAANHDLQKAKNDVVLNVVTLYTNVIFNQELFENAKYQLNSSQQQLDRIKKQVEAGALSISNQLNQEAQVATNELNMINQENALLLSVLQLKQAMQVPATENMQIEIPDLQLEDLVLEQNAEAVYKIALESMPEIKSAVLKMESANLALKANRGSYLPRLSLTGLASSNYSSVSNAARYQPDGTFSVGTSPIGVTAGNQQVYAYQANLVQIAPEYGQADQLKDNVFKSVSLQLSIPILNGLATRANVQRAIISKEIAEISITETQNTLRQSIETAFNDAQAASRSYASALKQVKAQEEAYRMNKQRFEVGALSVIEYQVSENDLFRAKSDLTRSKYNFIFKKKILENMGNADMKMD